MARYSAMRVRTVCSLSSGAALELGRAADVADARRPSAACSGRDSRCRSLAQVKRPVMRSTSASSSTASSITWSSVRPRCGEQQVERFGLGRGARDSRRRSTPLVGAGCRAARRSDAVTISSRDQLAGVHHRLGLRADRGAAATAARSMSPVDSWTMPRSRSTSRLAWVPLPAPGGPSRMMFSRRPPIARGHRRAFLSFAFLIRSPYWWAIRWLWIWVTVSIVTLTTISRLVPPRRKLMPALGDQEFGDQADRRSDRRRRSR